MALRHNTIVIRFLNISRNQQGEVTYNHKYPFGPKAYEFYITPAEKRKLDIGSVIEYKTPQGRFSCGVIIDNKTEFKSADKHAQVTNISKHHLRGYIREQYQNDEFAEMAYKEFRTVAYEARKRVAIAQHEAKEKAALKAAQ